jgi:hypothetical protein
VFPAIFAFLHSIPSTHLLVHYLCNRNQSSAAVWLYAGLLSNVAGSFLLAIRAFFAHRGGKREECDYEE